LSGVGQRVAVVLLTALETFGPLRRKVGLSLQGFGELGSPERDIKPESGRATRRHVDVGRVGAHFVLLDPLHLEGVEVAADLEAVLDGGGVTLGRTRCLARRADHVDMVFTTSLLDRHEQKVERITTVTSSGQYGI
jgi:uncharacterized Fe-S cluster-containing radical SAM superfamily protein